VAPVSLALPETIYAQPAAAPPPAVTATAVAYSAMTDGGQVSATAPRGFATTATPQMSARTLPAPFPSLAPMGPPASTVPLRLAVSSITAATAGLEILEARPTVTAGVKSATTTAGEGASAKKVTGTKPKVKRQEAPAAKKETTAGTTAAPTTTAGQQPSTSREERPRLTARRRRSTTPLVDETSYDEVSEEEFARQLLDETAAKKKNARKEETPTEEVTLE
jgi:hypothetical protein